MANAMSAAQRQEIKKDLIDIFGKYREDKAHYMSRIEALKSVKDIDGIESNWLYEELMESESRAQVVEIVGVFAADPDLEKILREAWLKAFFNKDYDAK